MSEQNMNPVMFTGNDQLQRGFGRNRLHSFGLTMIVMAISFGLYYLGLFGTVEGPLTPANMGATLSGLGVTQRHVIMVLISILIFAVSWNWIFNLSSALAGARMTCKATEKGGDGTMRRSGQTHPARFQTLRAACCGICLSLRSSASRCTFPSDKKRVYGQHRVDGLSGLRAHRRFLYLILVKRIFRGDDAFLFVSPASTHWRLHGVRKAD